MDWPGSEAGGLRAWQGQGGGPVSMGPGWASGVLALPPAGDLSPWALGPPVNRGRKVSKKEPHLGRGWP